MGIAIALFLMHVLEVMFFVGIAGSYVVAIVSFQDIFKNIDD
jgi:hypothetical protein